MSTECNRLHCNDTIGPCDDCPQGRALTPGRRNGDVIPVSEHKLCPGSYERPWTITKASPNGQAIRGRCPRCGKDLAINRATSGVRAHHV